MKCRLVSIVALSVLSCGHPQAPHEGCDLITQRITEARACVRLFYRCLLGENAPGCEQLLTDAESPAFSSASPPAPLGNAWAYLRGYALILRIKGIDRPDQVERIKMRLDVSPDALGDFKNIAVIVPDLSLVKPCGVMKEVRLPLHYRANATQPFGIAAGTISVNGVYLEPAAIERGESEVWRRALCPRDPGFFGTVF